MDYFGELLRKSRTDAGLTQKELAGKVNIDASSVSKMEKGVFLPVRKVAEGIADTLEMSNRPLTLYVSTKDKAALERFIFFLTAYAAGAADVQEIRLVEVEDDNKIGQAITQGTPAQQPPSVEGADGVRLFQILFRQLQELTAQVAQLTDKVEELKQSQTSIQADASQEATRVVEVTQPSVIVRGKLMRRDLEAELSDLVELVQHKNHGGKIMTEWNRNDQPARDLTVGAKWDEQWTQIHEQEGELLVVMKGLHGMTLDKEHYKKRIKPILEKGGRRAEFILHALERVNRRRAAFETQVLTYEFWHIMPIGALDWYLKTGHPRPEDWAYILQGAPASREQQVADIRHIIHLLKTYDNYYLGLLTGPASNDIVYTKSFWELKGGHTLVLEDLERGEKNVINKEKVAVDWFRTLFNTLLKSEGLITEKEEVIDWLNKYAELALEKAPAIS